jgi:Rrf2 family protein
LSNAIITTDLIVLVVIKEILEIMRVSTRARYGLRFMIELAANYGKGPVYMKDIAKSQEISEKYLSQILITLKSAGLVDGFRGVHGGYILPRPPSGITLKDIVGVLEGDLSLIECVQMPGTCRREPVCVSQEVWQKLGAVISETLDAITLEELVARQREKLQKEAMYYI